MSRKILVVAGEASGDAHGAGLVRAARGLDPGVQFIGIGSSLMRAAGARILLDAGEIAVVGVIEVLSHLPRLLQARRLLRRALREERPERVLLIDYPDFNLRFARDARRAGVPIDYFVSPQVWAWRGGRVRGIAKLVERMIVIFPFEQGIYREAGLETFFVGHPLLDTEPPGLDRDSARRRLGLRGKGRLLALLPGSRRAEVARLLPIQLAAAARLRENRPDLEVVIPVASTLPAGWVDRRLTRTGASWARLVRGEFHAALDAADAAVIASGTATLQAGLRRTPMVIVYRIHPLTAWLGRRMIRVRDIGLANLVAGRKVVPELVQENCTPARIAAAIEPLLDDPAANARMRADLAEVRGRLGEPGAFERAARILLSGSGDVGRV